MTWVLHAAALVSTCAALAGAALRLAAATGAQGLDRVVTAAPLAVSAAAAQALALGLVGLGSSPVALTVAAGMTWGATWRLAPAPPSSVAAELVAWWRSLSGAARAAAGGVAGVVAGWGAWLAAHPAIGGDGLLYHLPKIGGWVQSGRPGWLETLLVDNPVGDFPGANEVVLSWATGIARSLVPLTLWMVPLMMALLAASVWSAGRALDAPRAPLLAAVVALCAGPLLVVQASGPYTDLPALSWAACAVALAVSIVRRDRPALLGPLVLAAGLAVGTKTTVAPLVVVAVACALVGQRRRLLVGGGRALALAVPVALSVGGLWYLRNLITHGSPVWPFTALPGGDPVPQALRLIDGRVIEDPVAAVGSRLDLWAQSFAGHLLLLAGALVAPLLVRRREVIAGAGATLGAIVIWAWAPTTGFPGAETYDEVAASAFRYLTPALIPAVLTLAFASRAGGREASAVLALGAASTGWSVVRDAQIGFPFVPGPSVVAAVALGGAVGLALVRLPRLDRPLARYAAMGAIALAAVAAIAVSGPGFVARHLGTGPPGADVVRLVSLRPGFADGDRPVAMAPHLNGVLVGRRLSHRTRLIGLGETCPQVRGRARAGYVLLDVGTAKLGVPELDALDTPSTRQPGRLARCFAGRRPLAATSQWLVFGPPAR